MAEEVTILPNWCFPEFGHTQYQGIQLEVLYEGSWQPFQLFYFDDMLDKEQNYYIKDINDLKKYKVTGKIRLSRNSDILLGATFDMLRVKPTPQN